MWSFLLCVVSFLMNNQQRLITMKMPMWVLVLLGRISYPARKGQKHRRRRVFDLW